MNYYEPDDDSYLLKTVIEKEVPKLIKNNKDLKFLEIGCGSGIQLQAALNFGIKKENIFCCDINQVAVNNCKKLGFNCVKSDLFDKINKKLKFDVIVFNPPYLPEDENEPRDSKLSTTGGKKGSEIINKFLIQAKKYLNKKGIILLLTSSLTKGINLKGYNKKLIDSKKLFFEELYVFKLKINLIK